MPQGGRWVKSKCRAVQVSRCHASFRMRDRFDIVASRGYFSLMQSVGLKTLKNKLSEYVRAAAAGEGVLVTDRGRVIAEIGPPRLSPASSPTERVVGELAQQGLLRPATRRGKGPPPSLPVARFEDLMRELDADRQDR